MKKQVTLIVCLLVVLSLIAGCTATTPAPPPTDQTQSSGESSESSAADEQPKEIVIGNIQDISSATVVWGKSAAWGAHYAAKLINEAGGINGAMLKVITYDTKGDVNEAINAYNRLVQQDNVVAVVGPPTSNIGIALAPIAEETLVPIVGDFMDERATTKEDGTPWKAMFLTEPSCNQQAVIMADYALNTLGLRKFGILYDQSNSYSVTHAEPFRDYIIANGGEVVAYETFQGTDKDYKSQLTKIKAENPDALYIPAYAQQNALAYQQARQLGIEVPFIGDNSYFVPFASLAGDDVENVYFPNNVDYKDEKLTGILDAYRADVKEEPSYHMFFGYDNVLCIAEALRQVGVGDKEALLNALANLKDVEGYTGNISINPKTHRPMNLGMFITKVEGAEYIAIEWKMPPQEE